MRCTATGRHPALVRGGGPSFRSGLFVRVRVLTPPPALPLRSRLHAGAVPRAFGFFVRGRDFLLHFRGSLFHFPATAGQCG